MSGRRCSKCGNPMYYDEDFCTKCYPDGWQDISWFRQVVEDARKKTEGRSPTRRSADVNAAYAALEKEQIDEALTVNLN